MTTVLSNISPNLSQLMKTNQDLDMDDCNQIVVFANLLFDDHFMGNKKYVNKEAMVEDITLIMMKQVQEFKEDLKYYLEEYNNEEADPEQLYEFSNNTGDLIREILCIFPSNDIDREFIEGYDLKITGEVEKFLKNQYLKN